MMRSTPLKPSAFRPQVKPSHRQATGKLRIWKSLKSKQLAVTAEEQVLWDRMALIGCIACRLDGRFNDSVSIHHIDGRTKPGCHKLVLPLCAQHHQQDDTDQLQRIAIHPNKARFQEKYGAQKYLLALVMNQLEVV